jgi:glycosyltransferase involved in cell wall biosynthesis
MVTSMDTTKSTQVNNPVVSIILPTYNRVASLSHAIDSALAQTFADWELIVIDDTSTDGTAMVLDDFSRRDPRIKIIRNDHSDYALVGITKVLNQGLAAARGKYIARLDDDDAWIDPEKLAKQVYFLDTHPEYVVVGGGVIVVDGDGKERYRYFKHETDEEIRRTALAANPFSHTTVMFRRGVACEFGGYRARYAEDWDLWLSMGVRGKFYNFQEYFTAYTMNDLNKSFIHQRAQTRVILQFLSAHRREYPNFLRGYILNLGQYWYTFLPIGVRKYFQGWLSAVKRGI